MAESAPIRPEEKVKRKQWLGKLFARKKSKEENPAPLTKEQHAVPAPAKPGK